MTLESSHPPKLFSIQALRAVAALMVVLYHLTSTAAYGWTEAEGSLGWLGSIISAVGVGGVDLFFVISGVVMTLTCYDRFGSTHEAARFLRRRAARIYPLYWVVTAGVLLVCWLRPDLATRDKFDASHIIASLLLWPQSTYPIVAVGWTLSYELFFYFVFAALLVLPRRIFAPALALWSVASVALFAMCYVPAMKATSEAGLALPLYASPLVLEFIAGCSIALAVRQGIRAGGGLSLVLGMIGFIAVCGYAGVMWSAEAHFGLVRAAVFGSAAALVVYGAVSLELAGRGSPVWRRLMFWGDASYSMYLTHMYMLWLVAAAFETPADGAVSICLRTLAGVAACAAMAAVCHLLIERPLQSVLQLRPASTALAHPQRAAAR